jgi:hypothetical protein
MICSVFGLRWTHSDVWFYAFIGSLIIFVLSAGDALEQRFPRLGRFGHPFIHVLAFLAFLLGAAVSIGAWGRSDATLIQLIGMPFFLAGCIYAAFLFVVVVHSR